MFRRIAACAALGLAAAGALGGAAYAKDVSYEAAGETFAGYFAPAAGTARGLVVLVHDWDGVGDYERRRADMLAEAGYDAFAIDVYGGGHAPGAAEERMAAVRAALGDPARLGAVFRAGLDAAEAASGAEGVVVAGYCFGGTVALTAAQAGDAPDVAGWATFHGNFPGGGAWPADAAPLLVMHGGADQGPSMTDLAAFVGRLEAASATYDVEVYSGAPHAFTVFGSENYRERADLRSWDTFLRFLDERLGTAS